MKPIELLTEQLFLHERTLQGILEEISEVKRGTYSSNSITEWMKRKREKEAMIRLYRHSIKKLKK